MVKNQLDTGENEMTDRELADINIDRYMDLQRIIIAQDPVKEANIQMKAIKAKLEVSGVVVENITII